MDELLTSSRGFVGFKGFKTAYNHEVQVYESSSVEPSLWLAVDGHGNINGNEEVELTVLLRLDEAIKLRDQLSYLIDNHYSKDPFYFSRRTG